MNAAVLWLVLGLGAGAAASPPIVPLSVQHEIEKRVNPLFAYVPTNVPAVWRYAGWMRSRSRPAGLTISFSWRGDRYPGLAFNVTEAPCYQVRAMRTYRFGATTVHWNTTYTDSEAWHCVRRGGRRILFLASAPGNGSKNGPTGLALARMVASARPVR